MIRVGVIERVKWCLDWAGVAGLGQMEMGQGSIQSDERGKMGALGAA